MLKTFLLFDPYTSLIPLKGPINIKTTRPSTKDINNIMHTTVLLRYRKYFFLNINMKYTIKYTDRITDFCRIKRHYGHQQRTKLSKTLHLWHTLKTIKSNKNPETVMPQLLTNNANKPYFKLSHMGKLRVCRLKVDKIRG